MKNKQKLLLFISFFFLVISVAVGFSELQKRGMRTDSMPMVIPLAGIDDDDSENTNILPSSFVRREEAILFSHREHFYDEEIMLSFTAVDTDITDIYYTADGSPPDGDAGILYQNTISLSAGRNRVFAHTIKVCGLRSDGSYTDVYTHTYLMGEDVFSRFDTIIISLSTDPYNIYDYDYGIFVPGRLRDEYIAETGDINPDPPRPANYNLQGRDAERPVYVEIIDQYGQPILAQNAGMRVFGGWSRALDQKSIRLIARREYDPLHGSFDFDFFPNDLTHYGNPIEKYSQVVLRNNANDNPFAFMRHETVSDMASAILPDTQSNRPAAIYLNGAYYGFAWVQQRYTERYMDDHNEISNGDWAILRGGEWGLWAPETDELAIDDVLDYRAMYDMHELDLTNDMVFASLGEMMDIDNFLRYYAVQIYAGNYDWPWGNFRAYRYRGPEETRIHDGISTADGRWRWLLFDTDWTFGLYGMSAREESLGRLLGFVRSDRGSSPLLISLLRRDDMKERFTLILCDIMNHHFSPEMVEDTARRKEAERLNELTFNFRDGGAQLKGTWSSLDFVSGQVDSIITFGRHRPAEMRKQIEKYMKVAPGGFVINLAAHELAEIVLNTCTLKNEDFHGFYYNINTVTLSASRPVGYQFSHWLVNGIAVEDEILMVGRESAILGVMHVELVLKPAEDGVPVITLIDYVGGSDFIEIFNPHSENIDLRQFYISDDVENPYKQPLAGYILKPGESIRIYCNNYLSADALGGFSLSFNLRRGETILMTDMGGETVFSLTLPRLSENYVLVREMTSERYLAQHVYAR
ncbi:MAG: CotH kinase family protein [Lachnospiraceae bacterium]|jgi:hypothetical protein|nr:CotH kinase family protein [Lachnospiraceae bacterium]